MNIKKVEWGEDEIFIGEELNDDKKEWIEGDILDINILKCNFCCV